MNTASGRWFRLLLLAAVAACNDVPVDPTSPEPDSNPAEARMHFAGAHVDGWSTPINLGSQVNSTASEQSPTLSPDELSLYFGSTRSGGKGSTDIWVAHRASRNSDWETPVNLGDVVNTSGSESGPDLSSDGRFLYFNSDRPGGAGIVDIYVSRREDPRDDFGWGPPANIGPLVNTAAEDGGPESAGRGAKARLYFNRGSAPVVDAPDDLWSVPLNEDGLPNGPATPITELNSPSGDTAPSVALNQRAIVFHSARPGTLGGNDVWISTRRTTHDVWSQPENLGAPIGSPSNDRLPFLSRDGRTLIFTSDRAGGSGSSDLWISTRVR